MRISRRMRTRGLYPFWRSGGYYGNGVHSNVPRELSQASRVKGLQGPYIRKHLFSSSWNTRASFPFLFDCLFLGLGRAPISYLWLLINPGDAYYQALRESLLRTLLRMAPARINCQLCPQYTHSMRQLRLLQNPDRLRRFCRLNLYETMAVSWLPLIPAFYFGRDAETLLRPKRVFSPCLHSGKSRQIENNVITVGSERHQKYGRRVQ